ncbi:hypothetical protein LCGC14_1605490, partial [marine sediment metagenome]
KGKSFAGEVKEKASAKSFNKMEK